jgi:hypothetical protein
MRDIIITVPKSIKWDEYQKELDAAEQGAILNFKVANFPNVDKGSKCYICYNGNVIGYHVVSGKSEKQFTCSTTGKVWNGKFIERTGKLHRIAPIPMKGFQGFRYFNV